MSRSRRWRFAQWLGLVEDRPSRPRVASHAWWLRLLWIALAVGAVSFLGPRLWH